MNKINWGILGAGNIARSFAQDLKLLPEAKLLAIGSRSMEKAQQFASEFEIPRAYDSYEGLVSDPDIHVIYIATPHVFHRAQSLLCLNADKAILVEKPFTLNAEEAREVIDCARERNLFCMEAMWMRFAPAVQEAIRLVEQKAIGDVQLITASLGFYNSVNPEHRLFNPDLGGGAMLDLGVYPLSLIVQLLGRPSTISSRAMIGSTHVDEHSAVLMSFANGEIAQFSANIRAQNRNDAFIIGTEGTLYIHPPLYCPTNLTIQGFASSRFSSHDGRSITKKLKAIPYIHSSYKLAKQIINRLQGSQSTSFPYQGNGYYHEAAEVNRCLQRGIIESPIMPHKETIAILETMDTIRSQW